MKYNFQCWLVLPQQLCNSSFDTLCIDSSVRSFFAIPHFQGHLLKHRFSRLYFAWGPGYVSSHDDCCLFCILCFWTLFLTMYFHPTSLPLNPPYPMIGLWATVMKLLWKKAAKLYFSSVFHPASLLFFPPAPVRWSSCFERRLGAKSDRVVPLAECNQYNTSSSNTNTYRYKHFIIEHKHI